MPKHVTEDDLASGIRGMGGLATLQRTPRDSPFRDSRAEVKTAEVAVQADAPPPVKETALPPEPTPAQKIEVAKPEPKKLAVERIARSERKKASHRKVDVYTEPVTLRMSPSMRDEVESMARELQRAKTAKDERITPNTVMRVAVRLVLEHYRPDPKEIANTEEELYEVVAKRLKLK
jgi:hypothetical protein